jgi:hypothetical protein
MVNSSFPSGGTLRKNPRPDMKTTVAAALMFHIGMQQNPVRPELVKETLTNGL